MDQSQDAPLLAFSVTLPPLQNVVGPEGVMVAVGVDTFTLNVLVTVGQLVTKTETLSVSDVAVPASKVMMLPVVEDVMVPLPLVMLQAYVALGTASMEAV